MNKRKALAIAVAIAVFLLLSWTDDHYWDEFFYLYSVLAHSPGELLRFEVQTQHLPPGFFSEKLGHVVLLDVLTGILGGGERSLHTIQLLYALLVVGFVGAAYGLLRELLDDRGANHSALVLMFSPLALYLSFKVMSEVPALLFVTLGSWAFVRSFRPGTPRSQYAWLGIATAALALGMLFRVTMIVSFAGLGLALLLAGDERFERRRLFGRLVLVGGAAVMMHLGVVKLAGGTVLLTGAHIHNVVSTHPPLQRMFALALFLQAFALLVPFAWNSHSGSKPWLPLVWLVAAALPFLLGHEPRYYAPALVPLAMLAAAGLRGAAGLLYPKGWSYGWAVLLAALVLFDRMVLIPLMPFEVTQRRLLEAFETVHARHRDATYLVPWSSDYTLLRFAFPDANVVLCLTGSAGSRHGMTGGRNALSAADQWWVGGGHYVATDSALSAHPRPWYYIGWNRSPAAVRLQELLGHVGLERLVLKGPRLHNHLEESWIWSDSSWRLTPLVRVAQYHVYEVTPHTQPGS